MRSLVYAVAVLAAIGIMVGIVMMPENNQADKSPAAASTNANRSTEVSEAIKHVSISVPGMMCEHACFPKVKKAIESADSVASVEWDPKNDDDNVKINQVIVNYQAGFNADSVIEALESNGYEKSSVVQ